MNSHEPTDEPTAEHCEGPISCPRGRAASHIFPSPRELQTVNEMLRSYHSQLGTAMSKATYDNLQEMKARWDRAVSLPYEQLLAMQRAAGSQMRDAIQSFSRLVEAEAQFGSVLRVMSDQVAEIMRPSTVLIANLTALAEAVDRLEESRRDLISPLVFRPQFEFGSMCSAAISETTGETDGSPAVGTAAEIIRVGSAEATAMNRVVIEGILCPLRASEVSELPPTMATFNVFDRIQVTLARLCRGGVLPSQAREALAPFVACSCEARIMCHLIYRTNELTQGSAESPMFKRTTRLSEIENSVIGLVADSDALLKEFIGHMYQLIYEAPGADRNRLADYVDEEGFRTVQDIKHLRTFYQHHIGDGRDSEGARRKAGDSFGILIGKKLPGSAEDYQTAQLTLLRRVNRMLRRVIARLESAADSS